MYRWFFQKDTVPETVWVTWLVDVDETPDFAGRERDVLVPLNYEIVHAGVYKGGGRPEYIHLLSQEFT